MTPRTSSDRGFTLVEMVVVVAILAIMAIPLGNTLIAYFHNSDATTARLSQSHDAQIAAAYFSQDVASIGTRDTSTPPLLKQSVETSVASGSGVYPCGSAGTAFVRFAWDDFSSPTSSTQTRVAYVGVTPAGGTRELHRYTCKSSSAMLTSDTILIHNLASTDPVVTCSSTCTGTGPAVPQSVSLRLTISAPGGDGSDFVVTLTGQRRQS